MKNNDLKNLFIEMRAKGISFQKISKELKVAKSTLIEWSKQFRLEIDNLKFIQLEAMQEELYLDLRSRLETKANEINKMKEELSKRDYSEIPTEKLISLLFMQIENLEKELEGGYLIDRATIDDRFDMQDDYISWRP